MKIVQQKLTLLKNMAILEDNQDVLSSQIQKTFNFYIKLEWKLTPTDSFLNHYKSTSSR